MFVNDGIRWLVENGLDINVWRDGWIKETPLLEEFFNDRSVQQNMDMKVASLIVDGEYCKLNADMLRFIDSNELPVICGGKDRRVWCNDMTGNYSVTKLSLWNVALE